MPKRKLEEIRRRRRRARALRLTALLVIGALVVLGAWLYVERPWEAPPDVASAPTEASPEPLPDFSDAGAGSPSPPAAAGAGAPRKADVAAPAPEPLPALDRSDALVREAVARLSARADLAAWLVGEDLVRRFVVVVDNVAEGRNPRKHVLELKPEGLFEVEVADGRIWLEPETYARYDALGSAVAGLDADASLRLYRRLEPLVDEAYRELGYPDGDFDVRLRQAIAELLRAPVVEGEVELVRRGGAAYAFADPALEELSPAQKQLVRMGPTNTRRVQAKLRDLARALGVPADELPAPRAYRPARS